MSPKVKAFSVEIETLMEKMETYIEDEEEEAVDVDQCEEALSYLRLAIDELRNG